MPSNNRASIDIGAIPIGQTPGSEHQKTPFYWHIWEVPRIFPRSRPHLFGDTFLRIDNVVRCR
jgi:hypothetical protein